MEMDEDVTISQGNGIAAENDEKPTNVNRLHNIVNKLEEDNDLPSPKNSEKTFEETVTNGNLQNGYHVNGGIYSLENTSDVLDEDFDMTITDSEDSWLYESPQKLQTPGKKIQGTSEKWLKENLTTPELMRVRGSLSAKLDVMNIEKRKGMFNTDPQQRKVSNIRKESMLSVNSLDWDYDEG